MHEVRTVTPMPKGKGIRKDKFGRNTKMKRLNPYWVQEQSRKSGIHTDNLLKVVRHGSLAFAKQNHDLELCSNA